LHLQVGRLLLGPLFVPGRQAVGCDQGPEAENHKYWNDSH
jgi:hypothetical protein